MDQIEGLLPQSATHEVESIELDFGFVREHVGRNGNAGGELERACHQGAAQADFAVVVVAGMVPLVVVGNVDVPIEAAGVEDGGFEKPRQGRGKRYVVGVGRDRCVRQGRNPPDG